MSAFSNPILPGFHPDPSICRVGDDYYLVTSTFEYFPGVPVFHSRDLVNWRCIGHCLTRKSQVNLDGIGSSKGIYAPTIRHHDGTFYMVTTLVAGGGNFFVTARDPSGPWSDPVWLDQNGMDPSLFFDDDGAVYYTRHEGMGDGFIAQSRLDVKTGKLEGAMREIWRGTGDIWPEGPHLYKINGRYYLMIAEGGTAAGHMETVAVGDSPWGPFSGCPKNPILTHRKREGHPIQYLGHADMLETSDGWWAVCLGVRPVGGSYHHIGRETFLSPVAWAADGWPVFNGKGTLELVMPAPRIGRKVWPEEPPRDDFDASSLGLSWNFLRNPHEKEYSLTERPGCLRLWGSSLSMGSVGSSTFVGRRQTHHFCSVSARLSFDPRGDNEEAGLVLRYDEKNRFEIAVTRREGKRTVFVRKTVKGASVEESGYELPAGRDVILSTEASPTGYRLFFQCAGGPRSALGSAETRPLSSEETGGFTGVYVGMYATGNGRPSAVPADFDWFEYEGRE
jgi:xylan 1,4-beta-xylosidase